MRTGIHPTYYPNAQVVCSCGNTWTTGSTHEMIRTDICSNCHPFYTGEQRIIDTAGQVDRFMKRLDRYSSHQTDAAKRQKAIQQKQEQRFLKQQLLALDLSDRVSQLLHDANIITVGDLAKKIQNDKEGLLNLAGFGPKALEEVEEKLKEAREGFFAKAA
jgi:large subunit ribosomal protein L31